MKTTIDRVGRIRRVALALWRRLNPSSAADDGPRSFEEAQPPGLAPAQSSGRDDGSTMPSGTIDITMRFLVPRAPGRASCWRSI